MYVSPCQSPYALTSALFSGFGRDKFSGFGRDKSKKPVSCNLFEVSISMRTLTLRILGDWTSRWEC